MINCTYNEIKIAGVTVPLTAEVSHWSSNKVPWSIEWEVNAFYFLNALKSVVSHEDYVKIMNAIQTDFEQQWLDSQEKTVR